MKNIHDVGYKRLFSNRTIFREFLETFVKESWIKDLDLSTCEKLDKSFVSSHYKETESDIIYKIKWKDRDIYIIILLEFQSDVDRFMALRIVNYLTNFYMDYVESYKELKKLPAVFPIVLYNGDENWTAPTDVGDLIENNELLGEYALKYRYFKIIERDYSREQLLEIRNIVSTLFLAESYYDIEVLKREFPVIFQNEEDKQAASLFLNWFRQLSENKRITPGDYTELERVYKNTEEVSTMLLKALEKERKTLFENGFENGKKQGIKKIALKMLLSGDPIEKIQTLTDLSELEILDLRKQASD